MFLNSPHFQVLIYFVNKNFCCFIFSNFFQRKKVAFPGCTRDTFTLLNVKRPKYNFEIGGNTYIQPGEVPKI